MGKVIKITESQLKMIVENTVNQSDGFGMMSKKQGMSEEDGYGLMSKQQEVSETDNPIGSIANNTILDQFVSFLIKQGFKDWSKGDPKSYGMKFHYISRKPRTPANLSCSVGQKIDMDKIGISILFDGVIERAERYKTLQEFDTKSAIPKIERLAGKGFVWNRVENDDLKSKFQLDVYVDKQTAVKIIQLYNQIKLVGPYSQKKTSPINELR